MTGERTCKTCFGFHSDAYFCRPRDCSMAEWDTCKDHATLEEHEAQMKAREKKVKLHIDYVLVEHKPKTDVFTVFSRSSLEELGTIKWYPRWRQYCFFPLPDTVWSRGCLNEINAMMDKFTEEYRSRRVLAGLEETTT